MRSLAQDIRLTLFVKLLLLFVLWFVCFRGVQKPSLSTQQWLVGNLLHLNETPAIKDQ